MQIMPVERQQFWTRERILIILILILSLMIISILYFEIRQPRIVLQAALQGMNENYEQINVRIMEEGDSYALSFQGKILGNKNLRGQLPEYDLDIYLNHKGELFVKDLVDEAWKNAEELELDSLKEFLNMPFDLLEQTGDHFFQASLVQHNDDNHYVIKLSIQPEQFPLNMMQVNDSLLECKLFIDKDTYFIRQISYYLYESVENREILRRTYIFGEEPDLWQKEADKVKTNIAAR